MFEQLISTAMTFLCIVAVAAGLISGTCFYIYTKSRKKYESLLRLSIGFLCVLIVSCIAILLANATEKSVEKFIEMF